MTEQRKDRTALLVGYYGAGNLGDELMLVCLKDWLARQAIRITVAAQVPEAVEAMHGVPAVPNLPLFGQWDWVSGYVYGRIFRLWKALFSSDLVVLGGGDLIRDDVGGKTFLYSIEKMLVSILIGKPVHLVNVGIGEPRSAVRRFVLRYLLRRCRSVVVRDTASLQLCERYGVRRATLAPDIVFDLARCTAAPQAKGGDALLVCLREDANVFGKFSLDDIRLGNLAKVLDRVVEKYDLTIRFIPFQCSEWGDDSRVHQNVRDRMRHRARTEMVPWELNVSRLLESFGQARCVMAMRLHAGVLAAALGRPMILLPYDRKIKEIGRMLKVPFLEAEILDEESSAMEAIEGAFAARPTTPILQWDALSLGRQDP